MQVSVLLVGIFFFSIILFKLKVPFSGKLTVLEWPVLVFSLLLVVIETILSVITSILPGFVIRIFSILTSLIFSLVPSSGINVILADPKLDDIVNNVSKAPGFVEMCQFFGYEAEEHVVKTKDGYLLGIHRIGGPKGSNWRMDPPEVPRPVIYLHHGLLMNSEIWVSNIDPSKCLPFLLADMGYDVWLGNNRGNKYSRKHVSLHASSNLFWNFSIDDFALYDIPDTIDYILYIVGLKTLAYIGFSQGSAQALASLSINPELNNKISILIALAPAIAPPGLRNHIVDSLMRASPSLMYLFFGRKAILMSTAFWQNIMYPPLFVRTIDASLSFLFNWKGKNISYAQKLAAYPHLYSYTSVKSVVHWFQIIQNGRFHMYDDEFESTFNKNKRFYRVASFPTQNIITPVVLLYGKSDSLVDVEVLLSELPKDTIHIGVDNYEHLDMLWGNHVNTAIFPYIFTTLSECSPIDNSSEVKSVHVININDNEASNDNDTHDETHSANTLDTNAEEQSVFSDKDDLKSIHEEEPSPTPEKERLLKKPSLTHEELARRLSNSFSSIGINFGSSAPVVEVTTSHP